MRCLPSCLLGFLLLTAPPLAGASPETVPTADLPFDDVDPVLAQAEVARQIEAFVKSLEAQWGASRDAVRERRPADLQREDDGALVYAHTLFDHGVVEGYEFRQGVLVRGEFLLLQRPVNGLNEFIQYYLTVKERLTGTFGPPDDDRTTWHNDLYQPLPDYWGIAVQLGHLRYAATWTIPGGVLVLDLSGQHHSRLMLEYRSPAFADQGRPV